MRVFNLLSRTLTTASLRILSYNNNNNNNNNIRLFVFDRPQTTQKRQNAPEKLKSICDDQGVLYMYNST